MADKKKKQPKKPDGRGKRPRDPNQLAKWIVAQSTSELCAGDQPKDRPLDKQDRDQ